MPVATAVGAEMSGPIPIGEGSHGSGRQAETRRTPPAARQASPAPAKAEAPKAPPVRPAAPPPPPRPAAAPPRAAAGEERGWVSDLLRRASRDDEPADDAADASPKAEAPPAPPQASGNGSSRSQTTSSGPLNVLAADIAKAIDHDASVELWERHRRGEHNVFTRRLYTLQGQQTFDEIRKKYQRDQEFRAAVDRYVNDFEKLLAEVTRNSDRSAGNSYLTSDTGKVYTMLAHASGRFD